MFGIISERINVLDIRTVSHAGMKDAGAVKEGTMQSMGISSSMHPFSLSFCPVLLHTVCWLPERLHGTHYRISIPLCCIKLKWRYRMCIKLFTPQHIQQSLKPSMNIGYSIEAVPLEILAQSISLVYACVRFFIHRIHTLSNWSSYGRSFILYFSSYDTYKWPDNNGNGKVLLTTATHCSSVNGQCSTGI